MTANVNQQSDESLDDKNPNGENRDDQNPNGENRDDKNPDERRSAGDPLLEFARKVLADQPFSTFLGARVTAFGDGRATLELDIRDELRQQNGFVHGGVIGYAADNALTFAAGAAVGPGVLTAGYSVDYLRPADGAVLRAKASVVRAGRTRVVARCDVVTVDGEGTETLCAVAQGTISVAEPSPERRR